MIPILNEVYGTYEPPIYGVTPDLAEEIRLLLNSQDETSLKDLLQSLHPADIAALFEFLSPPETQFFLKCLKEQDPDLKFLPFVDHSCLKEIFKNIDPLMLAKALPRFEIDETLYLLENFQKKYRHLVFKLLPREEQELLKKALKYPEETAGRLMDRHIYFVPEAWTVHEVLNYFQKFSKKVPVGLNTLYVTNAYHQPIGEIPLETLLRAPFEKSVKEVMHTDLKCISIMMPQEEVASLFKHYELKVAPVVDLSGRLKGVITTDHVMEILEEQVEEEIFALAGMGRTNFYIPLFKDSYRRIIWLFATVINIILSTAVIQQFTDVFAEGVAFAVLMPIAAAMGGSTGMQVIAVVIRAQASFKLPKTLGFLFKRELLCGLINGAFFALLFGGFAYFLFKSFLLSFILAAAVFFNIMWSAFMGVFLPTTIEKLGLDPTVSAGPILAGITDIAGFALFLSLAHFLIS